MVKVLLATLLLGAAVLALWRTSRAGRVPTGGRDEQRMQLAKQVVSAGQCAFDCMHAGNLMHPR